MTESTFRLGQVTWALWRFAVLGMSADATPSAIFRSRIKQLITLDRVGLTLSKVKKTTRPQTLTAHKAEGSGTEATYAEFDAFCLAVALELQAFGLKQGDVMLLMGHLRPQLVQEFRNILENPPPFPTHLNQDGSWRTKQQKSHAGHDRRVFVVVSRANRSEAFPAFKTSRKAANASIFREPQICHGLDALKAALGKMDHQFRRAFVLEIAQMAARISEFLQHAPVIKRGRKDNP